MGNPVGNEVGNGMENIPGNERGERRRGARGPGHGPVERRRRPRTRGRAAIAAVLAAALLVLEPGTALAAQSASWGWSTDSQVMSFFGGIPYRGCRAATLTLPNPGAGGSIQATTSTTLVVGLASCSASTIPSSLNANTVRTRSRVYRNGYLWSSCDSGLVYNTGGQGLISASVSGCSRSAGTGGTWGTRGYYGWWDYDDATWRHSNVLQPQIQD